LVYFNNDQVKFLHIDSKPWFAQVKELSQQGNGVVIIDRPHEMRDLRKAEFYNRTPNTSLSFWLIVRSFKLNRLSYTFRVIFHISGQRHIGLGALCL
jgi:abortive infection bacteriophage resistance protein